MLRPAGATLVVPQLVGGQPSRVGHSGTERDREEAARRGGGVSCPLYTPLAARKVLDTSDSAGPRMDLVTEDARIVSAPWWAPAGRSAPGYGAPERDLSRTSRRCFASTGRGRIPGRLPRRPGRSRSGGHRAGGVPVRAAEPRPLRPAPSVRALAAPDRGQPRDRLVARTRAARELAEVPGSEDFDTGDLGTFSEGVAAGSRRSRPISAP